MIKFRAWDKETNKYFEPTYQAYMGRLEELTIALSGRLQKRTCRGMVDESVFPGRYVVEQFTGLTDVNGKDIYEGDAVQPVSFHVNLKRGKTFEVKKGNYVYGKWIAKDISNKKFGVDGCYFSNEMQLIGNVHENPELLKG
ncbi:YopX family protein [Lactiplantibacillus plantarum]|uniref:YopX family protein n=1 Tax=Lactiplantibacillus plantarum TaxID=1590 RepID=UPI001D07D076|nr:YopX family protein [Lactiplantibacillus plantarum]MCB7465294.1 YopX family protein [Lactiplantibacillus plantarum]MCB7468589.1 YopX family protein [Lactiplantibacillus plantarum]MCB7472741.1 YopX family protein [Lactiplantibacillus plantarum]MCB7475173.1 YopX family protein [Lactiplantibacillus plantarum]MCB7478774.1 YopX family protein [Lactiplantibacillus plantarum]